MDHNHTSEDEMKREPETEKPGVVEVMSGTQSSFRPPHCETAPGLSESGEEVMSSLLWYPWWPNRWLGSISVKCMTLEERGAYHELLDWQWQGQGYLPGDTDIISKCCGFDVTKYPNVLAKFPPTPDGRRANKVLLSIWEDQSIKHTKRSESGKKRWEKKYIETETEDNAHALHNALLNQELSNDVKYKSKTPDSEPSSTKKPFVPTPEMIRIGSWFNRRPTTVWSKKEIAAMPHKESMAEEDMQSLERFYKTKFPKDADYRRRSLITLLNNWNGEIDKARTWTQEKKHGLTY